jgi:hypothetical protein
MNLMRTCGWRPVDHAIREATEATYSISSTSFIAEGIVKAYASEQALYWQ